MKKKSCAAWLQLPAAERKSVLSLLRSSRKWLQRAAFPTSVRTLLDAADALESLAELESLFSQLGGRNGCERCGRDEEIEIHRKIRQLLRGGK